MDQELKDFYAALWQRSGFSPSQRKEADTELRVVARIDQKKRPTWQKVLQALLRAAHGTGWTLDISKKFFLKNDSKNGTVVHGWRIILKADDMRSALIKLTKAVHLVSPESVEVTEIPLPGGGQHRNISTYSGRKGVKMTPGGP